MRRPLGVALLTTGLLVLLPGLALAHASFDLRQVPAGSAQELVLRVPLEREAANDLVEVLVPGGFAVTSCTGAIGWSCDQAATTAGDTVVTLTRGPEGAGDAERFVLRLTAPDAEGVYAFPTIQTYDDGTEAAWIGEAGSDQPAPRLQVGDDAAPVESNGDATPHTPLATEEPSVAPTTEATPAPSPTAEATPAPSPTADAATPAPSVDDDTAPADESGPSPALLLVGGLLTVAVVAGAIARYRSVTE